MMNREFSKISWMALLSFDELEMNIALFKEILWEYFVIIKMSYLSPITKINSMKKLLLFFAATLITVLSANAQCTPDPQYTSPGVYPDSATGFMDAFVDCAYDQLITNVVPVDTTTMVGPFPVTLTFDSAVVVNVLGLPPGFSYSCYDAQNVTSPADQCSFEGGTTGCVSIFGTPTAGDEGVYNLSIQVDVYLEGGTSPTASQILDYYSITVLPADPSCAGGIGEGTNSKFKLFPNPVAESFTLKGLEGLDVSSISITNTEGKVLSTYADINSSSFDMNVADLEGGIYFVRIAYGSSTDVVRFIKE